MQPCATLRRLKKTYRHFQKKLPFTLWTSMNAFTDTVDRDLGLDNVSIYQVESNLLHFCCFAENLKFHYVWVLGDGSLAWLQVSDKWCAHTSSRYFCDTVSHSLACEPKRSYDSVNLFFLFTGTCTVSEWDLKAGNNTFVWCCESFRVCFFFSIGSYRIRA